MKMYILVLDSVPDSFVPVMTAHSSLINYKRFEQHETMIEWMETSFKKVVCRVTQKEFDKAKASCMDYTITTEDNLHDMQCTITFRPRETWPESFKYLRLWKPKEEFDKPKEKELNFKWNSTHKLGQGQTPIDYFQNEGFTFVTKKRLYKEGRNYGWECIDNSLIYELYEVV